MVTIYLLTLSLCHPERSEGSREHQVGVTEILPPFGRLNDKLCQEIYRSLNYLSVTICVICGEFKHPFTFFYASIVPPTSASPHIRSEYKAWQSPY